MADNQIQYLTFNQASLQNLIIDRLNDLGAFTDQQFTGSNISSVVDLMTQTFQSLMFYLNRTSTNTLFSDTNIYENMNRLVKIIDYKPIGNQTSTLSFQMSATEDLDIGGYMIPRYSFFRLGNILYSFNTDIVFTKSLSGTEYLSNVGNQSLLYQGKYIEYPLYTSIGAGNESFVLTPGDGILIDHFNIDVYVKDRTTNKWSQWQVVPTLFMESKDAKSCEIRLNENYRYEILFGDNINGKALTQGDTVAVYYLQSSGKDGEVGVGSINNKGLALYSSQQYNAIMNDVINENVLQIDNGNIYTLRFENTNISTNFADAEDVDSIKKHAPKAYRAQYRLVTETDFNVFLMTSFANILQDIKVFNNKDYLQNYIKYYVDIGLTSPQKESRVMFNQLTFADACNFNNIYIFGVPKTEQYINDIRSNFLTVAQKQAIINSTNQYKNTTTEIIMLDPVYTAVNIGINGVNSLAKVSNKDNSYINIIPDSNSRVDPVYIKSQIRQIFIDYFANANCKLGQLIDVAGLNDKILSLNGVSGIETRSSDNAVRPVNGLSLLVWNPVYQQDCISSVKNIQLAPFKFPFIYDLNGIIDNIVIQRNTLQTSQSVEF